MRLIIISGLSGSGKSVALHLLEDLGFYCIDNIPVGLLRSFVDEILLANVTKDGKATQHQFALKDASGLASKLSLWSDVGDDVFGAVTTSPRVVRVAAREPSLLHVELARESEPPAPITSAPAAAPAPEPDPLPPASLEPPAPAPPPPPRVPLVPAGTSFLSFNSIPASAVVLDGQPLGRTPRLNVPVKPGSHMVVFVHPEGARQARAVEVEPGARQTVAVRF